MRTKVSLVALIAAISAASAARAQTYDPAYPICLQTYGIMGNTISCGYTLMEQCQLSARARAAQCIVNPYFAGAPRKGRAYRRVQ